MITATFARSSAANSRVDGSQVASGIPRYEPGKSGQAVLIEEGATNLCLRDIGAQALGGAVWTTDGVGTACTIVSAASFHADRVLRWTYGSSGSANIHLNGTGYYTQTAGTAFTVSVKVRRSDGGPITSLSAYLYVSNNSNVNGACILTPLADGWYLAAYTRAGLTSGTVSLTGFFGMDRAYYYDFDGWMVEAKSYATSFIFGTRSNEALEIPLVAWKKEPPFAIECRFWYDPTRINPTDGRRVFSCTESGGFCLTIASSSFVSDLSAWVHTGGTYQIPKTPLVNLVPGWNDVALVVLPTAVQLHLNGVLRDQKFGAFTSVQWPAPAALKCFVGAENANGAAASNFLNDPVDEIVFLDAAETIAKYA